MYRGFLYPVAGNGWFGLTFIYHASQALDAAMVAQGFFILYAFSCCV